MLEKKVYILLLLLLVFNQPTLYAQDVSSDAVIYNEDITENESATSINMPPLGVFFKNIYIHPSVGIYETYKDEALASLGEEKQKWLDYLRVVANYQYGKNYSFSEDMSTVENMLQISSNRATNNYGVGVALSIPIGNLSSRKKRVRSKEAALRRVQYEYELAVEERKLMILEAYNTVIGQLATLKAKSDAATLYNAQIRISEADFKMGKINIIELSVERTRRANAIVSYEEGKVNLHSAITLLEMLSGVKVINN